MVTICPFCEKPCTNSDACPHFIGWTEDGKAIQPRKNIHSPMVNDGNILPTDVILNTGVSARVFRDVMFS